MDDKVMYEVATTLHQRDNKVVSEETDLGEKV